MNNVNWLNIPGCITEIWNPITCFAATNKTHERYFYNKFAQNSLKYLSGPENDVFTYHEERLKKPCEWECPSVVLVDSDDGLFRSLKGVDYFAKVIDTIIDNPKHLFFILTKRAPVMEEMFRLYLNKKSIKQLPKNLWLGISVQDQESFFSRIDSLFLIPAQNYFICYESAVGALNLNLKYFPYNFMKNLSEVNQTRYIDLIDWIIVRVGNLKRSETERLMYLEWVSAIEQQCRDAKKTFLFKQ